MSRRQPFVAAADSYDDVGWPVLPTGGAKGKVLLVSGFTGGHTARPSSEQINEWKLEHPSANIAIRMPPNVICIDVDAYGDKPGKQTLAEREREWGKLPATFICTARTDGVSGKRFFRVPVGLKWPGKVGPGVDIVQEHHRYAIVEPSIRPDLNGARERWYAPDGSRGEFPTPDDLPELPRKWVKGLTRMEPYEPREPNAATDREADAWLAAHGAGELCDAARQVATEAVEWFAAQGADGSHDEMTRVVWRLVRMAREGHPGVATAVRMVRSAFLGEVAGRRNGEQVSEWSRSLRGAIGSVLTDGIAAETDDPCTLFDGAEPEPESVQRFLAELVTLDQMESQPSPPYLVKNMFYRNTLAQVFGQSGAKKSFLMLDLACHLSVGAEWWAGMRLRPGKVVYIAAEGADGIRKRLRAWEIHNGKRPQVMVLPRPVGPEEWKVFTAAMVALRPALVVGDTQARLTPGVEENSSKDIGEFIDRLGRLRSASGACVVMVHHEGLVEGRARGSTAQRAAMDTQLRVFEDKETGEVVLRDEKQKDVESGGEVRFIPIVVKLGEDEDGDPVTSLVMRHQSLVEVIEAAPTGSRYQAAILDILRAVPYGGLSRAEVSRSFREAGHPKQRFAEAWDRLAELGRIVQGRGDKWRAK